MRNDAEYYSTMPHFPCKAPSSKHYRNYRGAGPGNILVRWLLETDPNPGNRGVAGGGVGGGFP